MDLSRKEMKRMLEADDEDLELLLGKITVELMARRSEQEEETEATEKEEE